MVFSNYLIIFVLFGYFKDERKKKLKKSHKNLDISKNNVIFENVN